MSAATSTILGIAGITAAVGGSVASTIVGSNAASDASNAQVNAANQAAILQKQAADDALAFQKQTYADQQKNLAPWLKTGTSALANLSNLLGVLPRSTSTTPGATPATSSVQPGASANLNPMAAQQETGRPDNQEVPDNGLIPVDAPAPPNTTFPVTQFNNGIPPRPAPGTPGYTPTPNAPGVAPATSTTTGTPDVSLESLINPDLGAAGSLSQGWTGKFTAPTNVTEQNDPGYAFRLAEGQKALERSAAARGNLLSGGTGKALQRYGQDYASNEYGNVYNRAMGEYTQGYNEFQQGQTNQFNRLASMAGLGQVSAQQLNNTGSQTAGNVSNILLTSGQQQGNNINNAGAARASGYVGSANALTGGLNNLGSAVSLLSLLKNQNSGTNNTALDPWAGVI